MPRKPFAIAVVALTLAVAPPAGAFRLGHQPQPVKDNPAERYAARVPDPEAYDEATHCDRHVKPGMTKLIAWMGSHVAGVSWGTYRCERWGPHSASLHAENRALDWHLDVNVPSDRAAARRFIELLLAPDSHGTPHALARRMGVEELIWDCSYWEAGEAEFGRYSLCYSKAGKLRKHVDPTLGHRNHIHIGLTKAGAAANTSFWHQPSWTPLAPAPGTVQGDITDDPGADGTDLPAPLF